MGGRKEKEMCAIDLNELSREELLDILWHYDTYIENFDYENEGRPVCLLEFVNNDYQDIKEEL